MIQVAIFEDHPIVLQSLSTLVTNQSNFVLKFSVTTKLELYKKLENFPKIDVLILDFLAKDVKGMELYDYVNKNFPKVKMISFTSLSSPILIENLLATGVKGYVNKNQEIEDLLTAINTVADGSIYLPVDYEFLIKKVPSLQKNNLTEREIEILQLIAKEFTTADIASMSGIAVNTVENHRKNMFKKMNVKNVAGLIFEASKLGYLE